MPTETEPKQATSSDTTLASEHSFHDGWHEWLASNLIKGVDRTKLIEVMNRNGFPASFGEAKILEILRSPLFRVGQKISQSQRKLSTLFSALSAQYKQSGYAETFEKYLDLSPDEFYNRFYYPNRPVVAQGLMKGWSALSLWTPEFFANEFGDCEIEITSERDSDVYYEDNFSRHRAVVRMRDFVQRIQRDGETNDYYLVAKNYLLAKEEFKPLFCHFSCPEGILDPSSLQDRVKLWFGPKGTVTPLHHDACNILLGQVYGRKRIVLIAPFDINHVYNNRECFSAVDIENIDYEKFPLMKRVSMIDVVLEPGEFVLLPIGWWHWVKALDVSISLSFTNFCVEQTIVWGYRY